MCQLGNPLSDLGIKWWMVSVICIVASAAPYMWGIYRRQVKRPVVSTWFLWMIIGNLLLVSSYQAGAKTDTTLWPIILGAINPTIIFFLSLRFGKYEWKRLDTGCVWVCVCTVVVWQVTQSPLLGLIGGLLADAVASMPQMIKNWEDPKDEPVFPWAMFTLGSALNVLAIQNWVLDQWLYPVWMTLAAGTLTLPVVLARLRTPKSV